MAKTKRVRFAMFWECYGYQEVDLPDDIDANDKSVVMEYLDRIWDSVPIPEGEYISGTDEIGRDVPIEIYEV